MTACLEARGLEFAYGEGAFHLTLEELVLERGTTTAIIGPSGCGKTTLLRLLTGQVAPQAGGVVLGGKDLSSASDTERRARRLAEIGLVFQDFALLEYLSVEGNLRLPFHLNPELEDRGLLKELAEATGIAPLLARKPARLSQGERQRVALCRALITGPALVVADEPTGNLDPDTAARAMDLCFEQVAARGATLLVVTHDHGLLPRFDRVVDLAEAPA